MKKNRKSTKAKLVSKPVPRPFKRDLARYDKNTPHYKGAIKNLDSHTGYMLDRLILLTIVSSKDSAMLFIMSTLEHIIAFGSKETRDKALKIRRSLGDQWINLEVIPEASAIKEAATEIDSASIIKRLQ